jgi:redox-sensitive bicupin YhaK (pirin superfamily)
MAAVLKTAVGKPTVGSNPTPSAIAQKGEQLSMGEANDLVFQTVEDSRLLLMSGQPLDETLVGRGPFVMNGQAEIHHRPRSE